MATRVLLTGGAEFLGAHLADELLAHGHDVRVFENLVVAGPVWRHSGVEFFRGNIRDAAHLRSAFKGVDAVFHFGGMPLPVDAFQGHGLRRFVVGVGKSLYGEGLYRRPDGCWVEGPLRPTSQLDARDWELRGPSGEALEPVPTPEHHRPKPPAVDSMGRYEQERLSLAVARDCGIPAVGLRFFNVYGPGLPLQSPLTGALGVFAARYLRDQPALLHEDGLQRRDFVHVSDAVRLCRLVLEKPDAGGKTFNVGHGSHRTLLEAARRLAEAMGKGHLQPQVTGRFQAGDVRHCFADTSRARQVLGYFPRVALEDGLGDWARSLAAPQTETSHASATRSMGGVC